MSCGEPTKNATLSGEGVLRIATSGTWSRPQVKAHAPATQLQSTRPCEGILPEL